ncbi:MAG: AAA family ATPase [Alphaproteobacteria bacterium]|jgi:hypothetical protein|nr:AAA family ATPase [Alphaproteobacteria bacterium]MBT4082995.1 AAA family ATPase [Alphaproteobacteria bacterium]
MTYKMKPELPIGLQSYFDHGFSIIPFKDGQKLPLLPWVQFQKTAAGIGRVRLWASDYPDCNWGIVTGEVSGIVVLDFDTEEAEAEAKEFGLPETPMVKTPRGRHYYYKHPGQQISNATGLFGGMDIRGDGGCVLAPPSVRFSSGGEELSYEWEVGMDDMEFAKLPDWVPEVTANTQSSESTDPGSEKPVDIESYTKAVLIEEMDTLMRTREGERNDQLNRSAYSFGQLIGSNAIDRVSAEAILEFVGAQTGMEGNEIEPTIRSGLNCGITSPKWEEEKPKPMFEMLTVDQVLAMERPKYLVEGIVTEESLAAVFGEPESGKSFLALDWALCIASGVDWLSKRVLRGGAVYVTGGEGVFGYNPRIAVWKQNNPSACTDNFRLVPSAVDMTNTASVQGLVDSIRYYGIDNPKVIFIDTLARSFGSGDENNASDMGRFVRGADLLRSSFPGSSAIVVHHTGKEGARGLRGSSALLGALSTSIKVELKQGRKMRISCDKQKDDERFSDLYVNLEPEDLEDDFGYSSCVLVPANDNRFIEEAISNGPIIKNDNDQKAHDVLRKFGPSGTSFSEWRKACGIPPTTFKKVIKRLVAAGHVEKQNEIYVVSEISELTKILKGTLDPVADPED